MSNIESKNHIVFYNLVVDEETQFPKILEALNVDDELHVQLKWKWKFDPITSLVIMLIVFSNVHLIAFL